MATKTADKYKLIVNLAEYFDDIRQLQRIWQMGNLLLKPNAVSFLIIC